MVAVTDRHIEEHAKIENKPNSVKRDRRAWDRCVLPKLGKRRVKDVNRADVARLMTEMAETPAMANKVLTLLSKASNLSFYSGTMPDRGNRIRTITRLSGEKATERL